MSETSNRSVEVMKNRLKVGALCLGLAVLLHPLSVPSDVVRPAAFIMNITGKLEVKRANPGVWQSASIGVALMKWDKIRTGDFGRAEVKFTDGTTVKVGQNTELEIRLADKKDKNGMTRGAIDMTEGETRSLVTKKAEGEEFKVFTKTAVAAVKGTDLGIKADDRRTTLLLYEGIVDFRDKMGNFIMVDATKNKGQVLKSEIDGTNPPTTPVVAKKEETQTWTQTMDQAPKLRLDAVLNPASSPAGVPFKISVSVLDQAGKPVGGRSDKVELTSSSKTMMFSADGGTKWSDKVTLALQDGKGSAAAKDTSVGGATITAVSTDLSPVNESATIIPQQKSGKKSMKGAIKTKDGKEFKFYNEYQKQP